jgi:hypothetical protein
MLAETYLADLFPAQLEALQATIYDGHRDTYVVARQRRRNGLKIALVQVLSWTYA